MDPKAVGTSGKSKEELLELALTLATGLREQCEDLMLPKEPELTPCAEYKKLMNKLTTRG